MEGEREGSGRACADALHDEARASLRRERGWRPGLSLCSRQRQTTLAGASSPSLGISSSWQVPPDDPTRPAPDVPTGRRIVHRPPLADRGLRRPAAACLQAGACCARTDVLCPIALQRSRH
ncbi:hypothetical protein K466DRAFT_355360 [Polyporus arcularius HHB13444]|uniref:Uncharacterized protein n=1 Tax=Polyporus arcularius HHB13444 TaxID=1314778 RepID=A0A5C3PXL6_9APHY|nr:hypothetical protein K466DRAFT_355360 [Polyporus arcularius HHB13444]